MAPTLGREEEGLPDARAYDMGAQPVPEGLQAGFEKSTLSWDNPAPPAVQYGPSELTRATDRKFPDKV